MAVAAAVTSCGVVAARAAAVCVVPTAALIPSCVLFSASMKKAHHPTSSTSRGYGRRARRGGKFGSLTRARVSGISLLTASRVAEGSEFVRIVGGGGGGSGAADVHGMRAVLLFSCSLFPCFRSRDGLQRVTCVQNCSCGSRLSVCLSPRADAMAAAGWQVWASFWYLMSSSSLLTPVAAYMCGGILIVCSRLSSTTVMMNHHHHHRRRRRRRLAPQIHTIAMKKK
jgi:hypothetical protein